MVCVSIVAAFSFTGCKEGPTVATTAAAEETTAAAEETTEAAEETTAAAEIDEREALRKELAQKYKNAEPGEKFVIGHITFHLSQEYAMMVYQANEQAAKQLGLEFIGAVATSDEEWISITESMIASGAKAITMNVPSIAVLPEIAKIANDNNVFILTHFGYTQDVLPGDLGPRWVVDNTPLSDEQTYLPLMLLFEKMKQNGKTKLLHHQSSKVAATVSTVYINLGVFQAWKEYPEIEVLGHQYGEWHYEGGRKAGEASLAIRTDYEGFWGANDSQTMGALKALEDRGINIGPFTASRDMELTTAQAILDGNFVVSSGFAIPYFGGRLVPMAYDMCVGAWYPLPEEMIQAGRIDCYGYPGEIEKLAEDSGVINNPSFKIGPTEENMNKILKQMKATPPEYPFDFRLASISKSQELGLTFDKHAGGDLALGQNDYYFPVLTKKFGSVDVFKKHLDVLFEHFLDFSWADTWAEAEEYAKQFTDDLKVVPDWQ